MSVSIQKSTLWLSFFSLCSVVFYILVGRHALAGDQLVGDAQFTLEDGAHQRGVASEVFGARVSTRIQ